MKINFKKIIVICIVIIILIYSMITTYRTQELYWAKSNLAKLIGNFEDSDLIDQTDNMQVWYVYQYENCYIVVVTNGELYSKIQIK